MIIQFPNREAVERKICGTCESFDTCFAESNEMLEIDKPDRWMRKQAREIPACPDWKSSPRGKERMDERKKGLLVVRKLPLRS